ncbi:SH3 domain-containing protein [Polymorphum gilvum]|uniref:Bacterial SH3-like region n=1 Tax=Polymorphum gilvum (strain LMG 25793 / CGMCC 1.9160 / SL003B-26A1) TaxID=991905 RepID=F2IYJ1_POLGS|nr:SH3 domain-containing protein [Polymorphum gilvum]ADZ68504.1 Bacterial SH3-like region [Polymorphum gilvum SL003B-26A1]
MLLRFLTVALAVLTLAQPALAQATRTGTASGLPVPRFVSLKSDRVNVRMGPSRDHEVAWTYVQAGLPVEIVQEFENWRRVRDWEGKEGWLFHSLLSGRRTGLVTPWESADTATPLRASARSDAPIVAYLQSKVLAEVRQCRGGWCRVEGAGYRGWIDQTRLFGVYPDETID